MVEKLKLLDEFENAEIIKEYLNNDDDELTFTVRDSSAFIKDYYNSMLREITFENSQVTLNDVPAEDGVWWVQYETMKLTKQGNSYVLEFTHIFEDEHYVIKFDNITATVKAFKAEDDEIFQTYQHSPWDYIAALACNINEHFKYRLANEKEKKILGLVKYFANEIYVSNSVPAELYKLIEKHGLEEVLKPPYIFTHPYLCKKKFEPLWRDVFALFSESQEDLPSYSDESIPEADFENHKHLITERMEAWGYTGTYPDFYKKGRLMKPTLFKTYDLTYVTTFEKFVEHHIHCYSYFENDVIQTVFYVGTAFNKKDEDKTDIYSTMFDCGGKAVFSVLSTTWVSIFCDCSYDSMTRMVVKAAVKRANLQKADKDDRMFRSIGENRFKPNYGLLILAFVMFTVGFSLIFPLLSIILDGDTLSEVAAAVREKPVLAAIGPIGGLAATALLALFDYLSGKK